MKLYNHHAATTSRPPMKFVADVIGADPSAHPHVQAWLPRMKACPSEAPVHAVIDGFAAQLLCDEPVTL